MFTDLAISGFPINEAKYTVFCIQNVILFLICINWTNKLQIKYEKYKYVLMRVSQ